MRKEIYLDIMERALASYSTEDIDGYVASVQTEGLKEHGFPRLTANIAVLLSCGRVGHMRALCATMMDLCTTQMPNRRGVANDFSVREICFALDALERAGVYDSARLEVWKDRMRQIDPYATYDCIAKDESDTVANWAAFAAGSEVVRCHFLGGDSRAFIECNISSQMKRIAGSGMYIEPNEPMLYDVVGRLQLSIPLFMGYDKDYAETIDSALRRAGEVSLRLQTPHGDLPFGGRSNQFIHNEPTLAALFEYEAARHHREGNDEKAGEYKAAAQLCCKSALRWLAFTDSHIKNRYDPHEGIGCEKYAYFLKYMITVASNAYHAYLYADDTVTPTVCPAQVGGYVYSTEPLFHKTVLTYEGYHLAFDTAADFHYDANGLGRVERAGAPSAICLSVPFARHPNYKTDGENALDASLCVYALRDGALLTGAEAGVLYDIGEVSTEDGTMSLPVSCTLTDGATVKVLYEVSQSGVTMRRQSGDADGFLLPVFLFDGRVSPVVRRTENSIEVSYEGHVCRYTYDGTIEDDALVLSNRNGRYAICRMKGTQVHIAIE